MVKINKIMENCKGLIKEKRVLDFGLELLDLEESNFIEKIIKSLKLMKKRQQLYFKIS